MFKWLLSLRRWAVVLLLPNDELCVLSRHWTKADALTHMGLDPDVRICKMSQVDLELMK